MSIWRGNVCLKNDNFVNRCLSCPLDLIMENHRSAFNVSKLIHLNTSEIFTWHLRQASLRSLCHYCEAAFLYCSKYSATETDLTPWTGKQSNGPHPERLWQSPVKTSLHIWQHPGPLPLSLSLPTWTESQGWWDTTDCSLVMQHSSLAPPHSF